VLAHKISTGIAVTILGGGLILSGCGSSAGNSTGTANQGVTVASTAVPGTTVNAGRVVTVDVQAGEYYFKSPMTTFKVGVPYRFVVDNIGDIHHEFMLVQPMAPGMMSMEEMDKMAIGHIEESDMQAHQTASIDVTFTRPYPAGTLEMACHIEQHYQNGMHLPITVTP
jgi:uncharacterized cupredoxin-like copper-binding protein